MVLVTGATGILGRIIMLELLKRGYTVRAAKRSTSDLAEVRESLRYYTDAPDEFFDKIEWVDVDFTDIHSLEHALKGISTVYHSAGKVSFYPADEEEIYKTNVTGTTNLLYACENSSVKEFCFISSVAVLDGLNDEGLMDEDSDFNPKLTHSPYAISKHLSEMEVWRASAEGLKTVIVNPGIILGSGNWNASSGELFSRLEKYPFAMSGSTSYVDVRDVAQISVRLMEEKIFNERFILSAENCKYLDIATIVRKKLGKPEPKVISKSILNAGYLLNLIFGGLFPGLRIMNKTNLQTVSSNSHVSNKKIIEKLNWKFIPVRESLEFHLSNYISHQTKQ